MGAMTSVMLAMGAVSAATSVAGGIAQKREGEANAQAVRSESAYNAGIYRQQSGMVEQQKNLKAAQDDRKIRFVEGKHTAMTAAKGLELSGSPMAILVDTMTQLEMDKAITGYNYDMEKYGLESQAQSTERRGYTLASQYRSAGRNAMTAGIVSGISTLAMSGMSAAASKYAATAAAKTAINTSAGATIGAGV